jgi:hypothetical protein
MGNQTAGTMIAQQVRRLVERRKDESAIDLLDAAMAWAKAQSGFSSDAEFEAEDPDRPGHGHPDYANERDPHPKSALGLLMVEAFAPNGLEDLPRYEAMLTGTAPGADPSDEDAAQDAWYDEVCDPFKARYDLC